MGRAVAALAVAVALVAVPAAHAGELTSPRPFEAFFGYARADAPPGATHAELYVGIRRVARLRVEGRRVVFRVPRHAGRFDLRIRFVRDSRLMRRDESRSVWLLPENAQRAVRERRRDAAVSARFGALGRTYRGYAALGAHDLATGRAAGWNSDASFPAASIVKLGVLVAALQRWGPSSTAWPLIRDLATWSSNDASNRLLVLLGGSEAGGTRIVNETLWRLGARSSTFTGNYRLGTASGAAPLGDTPRPLPILTFRRTTAHDAGRILLEIHAAALGNRLALRRTGLTRYESRLALGLLLSSDPSGDNAGLFRQALDRDDPVAQKHGWTTKIRHSAAIVYGPRGPVILVVLTFHPSKVDAVASRSLGGRAIGIVRSAWY